MPIYDFTCPSCGAVDTVARAVSRRDEPLSCAKCNSTMERVKVYKPHVAPDYPGYVSPASGKWIEGRRAHIEDLKSTGCRIYEPGETEAFIKRKAQRQADFDRAVEAVVDQAAQDIDL